METFKDIFFLIGSVLGILSFIDNALFTGLQQNREKWQAIRNILKEDDIQELLFQIDQKQRIQSELLDKFNFFKYEIESDAEELRFTGPFQESFKTHKLKFVDLYVHLRSLISEPFFNPPQPNEYNEPGKEWVLNKNYFYKNDIREGELKLKNHMDQMYELAEKMKIEYRSLYFLANIHSYEFLFAKHIVKKRAKNYD